MGQHERASPGFALFMRLFIISLAAMISRGIKELEVSEVAHGPEKTDEAKELAEDYR